MGIQNQLGMGSKAEEKSREAEQQKSLFNFE